MALNEEIWDINGTAVQVTREMREKAAACVNACLFQDGARGPVSSTHRPYDEALKRSIEKTNPSLWYYGYPADSDSALSGRQLTDRFVMVCWVAIKLLEEEIDSRGLEASVSEEVKNALCGEYQKDLIADKLGHLENSFQPSRRER